MTKHSYSKISYQCEECDFWGMSIITLEVQVRKVHSDNITCALCDFTASYLEGLETHLTTLRFTSAAKIKKSFKH